MKIGNKIRGIRGIRGYSQENMAQMLNLSLLAYGDIERDKKDITLSRLEQISDKLGVSVINILQFDVTLVNLSEKSFSDQDNEKKVKPIEQSHRDLTHKIQILELEISKLKAEKDKAELEAKYWKEKYGF